MVCLIPVSRQAFDIIYIGLIDKVTRPGHIYSS